MTDGFYDALRWSGEYPPKGYGWKDREQQIAMVKRKIARGELDPWVIEEAKRFGIPLPPEEVPELGPNQSDKNK